MMDRTLPKNKKVELTKRGSKAWIKVTPLDPQPEPKNLATLKAEISRRWHQIYLLDMLKEADLHIGFTSLFKSPTPQEALPREVLQIRLLLCLYALGTNAEIARQLGCNRHTVENTPKRGKVIEKQTRKKPSDVSQSGS